MQLESLRAGVYGILDPLTGWLSDRRVHPNLLTTVGFAVTMGAAYAFHRHAVHTGGFLVLLGGFFDILDGRVARLTELGSKFGAFYDSTLDRMSEIAVYFGLLSLYNDYRLELADVGMIYMIMLAMGGSLMVSYTRARAEALGLDCRVGLMPRAERVVLLGAAALFFGLAWDGLVLKGAIVILAVTTNFTALQRIIWVYQHAAGVPLEEPGLEEPGLDEAGLDEAGQEEAGQEEAGQEEAGQEEAGQEEAGQEEPSPQEPSREPEQRVHR